MGRRNKKQFQPKKKGNEKATDNGASNGETKKDNSASFTNREKQRVRKYLEEYRRAALLELNATVPSSTTREQFTDLSAPQHSKEIRIAGIIFPSLTKECISRPFLALSSELAFRQRQFVHDCSITVGLYHCGKGEYSSAERYVAVSIYCDVFDRTEGFCPSGYIGFYRSFPPWYTRRDNAKSREGTTKERRSKIQELIDQPGKCVRDDIDALNFNELDGVDLSKVPPPNLSNDNDESVPGCWMLVDTVEKMKQCMKELSGGNLTELAFDLEAYNQSKYTQQTCLLQLSSNLGKEYVIDPLADGVWKAVSELGPLFEDPTIVKIGHSISGLDGRCLHRDFGIFISNVFDTYEAAKVLNLPAHGLAAVCEYYGLKESAEYAALKGEYQTTDWRRRPLNEEMILYGLYDVHFLIKIRKLMMRDLTYAELFSGGDAESKLVADSLAATLQRIQDFEDGIEYETASEAGSEKLSLPAPESANLSERDNAENGLSGGENGVDTISRSERQAFFTPTNSNLVDDSGDDRGVDSPMMENAAVDDIDDVKMTKVATAQNLRMQPRLMRVISFSQERCLDLWDSKLEPHYNNAVFVSQVKGAKKEMRGKQVNNQHPTGIPLTDSQIQLYEDLVRLRAHTAHKIECLPGFICSLDELVHIAVGRPTSIDALRVINYFLPEILRTANEETSTPDDSFLKQIFILAQRSLEADGVRVGPFDAAVKRHGSRRSSCGTNGGLPLFVRNALIASAVCGGIYLVAVALTRNRRK